MCFSYSFQFVGFPFRHSLYSFLIRVSVFDKIQEPKQVGLGTETALLRFTSAYCGLGLNAHIKNMVWIRSGWTPNVSSYREFLCM